MKECENLKNNTKTWLISFIVSMLTLTSMVMGFSIFMNIDRQKSNAPATDLVTTYEPDTDTEPHPEVFEHIEDNVGAVTFTEDQITELARNIFSLDGFLSNVHVGFERSGDISVTAKIKDKEKLLDTYPELNKYSMILSVVEGKNISLTGSLSDEDGMATFSIEDVTVAGMSVDKSLLSPFIEEDDFSEIFNVEYDSIEITEGMLVFKNGLPDILQY